MATFASGGDTQATAFTIKILDGLRANDVLSLEGRQLPYRTLAYETQQRSKLTYYAGNPVATQQLFGPVDNPSTINGIWKDIFLGNGAARNLVDTFDDLCRSGASVEVTWGDRADKNSTVIAKALVRRGIIKRFKHSYLTTGIQDITWEIEFEFRGRDEPTAPPITGAGVLTTKEGFGELVTQLVDTLDTLNAYATSPFNQLSGFSATVQQVFDLVTGSLANAVDFFNGTARSLIEIANLPRDVVERGKLLAQASADSMKRAGRDLLVGIGTAIVGADVIGGRDEGLGLLDQRDMTFTLLHQLDASQELCLQTVEALAGQIEPEVIAEVTPIPGSDLRDLAQRFYGDADLWPIIANYNGLDNSRVPNRPDGPTADASRPLLIPKRPEGDMATMSQGVC